MLHNLYIMENHHINVLHIAIHLFCTIYVFLCVCVWCVYVCVYVCVYMCMCVYVLYLTLIFHNFRAILCLPNVMGIQWFGKLVFITADIAVGIILAKILEIQKCNSGWSYVYLLNPLSAVVSARGNADSLIAFFVITSLYFVVSHHSVLAGILYFYILFFVFLCLTFHSVFYFYYYF